MQKAELNHSKVIEASTKYTSQRCPRCGRINKENRDHELHLTNTIVVVILLMMIGLFQSIFSNYSVIFYY